MMRIGVIPPPLGGATVVSTRRAASQARDRRMEGTFMRVVLPVVLVLGLALAGCKGSNEAVIDPGDGGNYSVQLDPSRFVATIDNPWLPFTPGSRWVYEAGGGERNEVVVTDQTRRIMGITATVVRDVETRNGELVEETFDWYAQDRDGNVWYLGEDTRAVRDGEPSPAGSWEAGPTGPYPGSS
jgi:hypothetical protein